MFVQTQRLDYPDHKEEIAYLNNLLARFQDMKPFPLEYKPVVENLLARLDCLMLASKARVSLYDPREERRC